MLLLKNGFIVQNKINKGNLLIDGDIISGIGAECPENVETIDCDGLYVVPGLIDMHVHLREPGEEYKEDIESGSIAAAQGGVTTLCSMANTHPPVDNAPLVSWIINKGRKCALADVLPFGTVSRGLLGEELSDIGELLQAGVCCFSDDGKPVSNSELMRRALEYVRYFGSFISCHEEDVSLFNQGVMHEGVISAECGLRGVPAEAESIMVARDIALARLTRSRVHICHVSSRYSVELIRRAKEDGINITAEVTPNHISLTDSICKNYDTFAKVNPPLRTEEDRDTLTIALKDGVIDCVASDHAPHHLDDKFKEFDKAAFGVIGMQLTIPLLLKNIEFDILSWQDFVRVTAGRPAQILGLSDRGALNVGMLADIAVIDKDSEYLFDEHVNASKSFNTPYWKKKLKGRAKYTIKRGKIVNRLL
jgi:dihydroorotase